MSAASATIPARSRRELAPAPGARTCCALMLLAILGWLRHAVSADSSEKYGVQNPCGQDGCRPGQSHRGEESVQRQRSHVRQHLAAVEQTVEGFMAREDRDGQETHFGRRSP